jgi:hypothetical protein
MMIKSSFFNAYWFLTDLPVVPSSSRLTFIDGVIGPPFSTISLACFIIFDFFFFWGTSRLAAFHSFSSSREIFPVYAIKIRVDNYLEFELLLLKLSFVRNVVEGGQSMMRQPCMVSH